MRYTGSKRMHSSNQEGVFRLEAPPIDTVSTVGSGDSFLAGCCGPCSGSSNRNRTKNCYGMEWQILICKTGYVSCELVDKFIKMVVIN